MSNIYRLCVNLGDDPNGELKDPIKREYKLKQAMSGYLFEEDRWWENKASIVWEKCDNVIEGEEEEEE